MKFSVGVCYKKLFGNQELDILHCFILFNITLCAEFTGINIIFVMHLTLLLFSTGSAVLKLT
jgi:hypothetical protein